MKDLSRVVKVKKNVFYPGGYVESESFGRLNNFVRGVFWASSTVHPELVRYKIS